MQNSGIDVMVVFEFGQDLLCGFDSGRGEICSGMYGEWCGDVVGKRFGYGRNFFGEQEWVELLGVFFCF